MHPTPLAITVGGAVALALLPPALFVLNAWLRYHAARWVAKRWPSDDDRRRRDDTQAAVTWGDLYDAHTARLGEIERRQDAIEARQDAIESKSSKAERSLRRRGLWDSVKASQVPTP